MRATGLASASALSSTPFTLFPSLHLSFFPPKGASEGEEGESAAATIAVVVAVALPSVALQKEEDFRVGSFPLFLFPLLHFLAFSRANEVSAGGGKGGGGGVKSNQKSGRKCGIMSEGGEREREKVVSDKLRLKLIARA